MPWYLSMRRRSSKTWLFNCKIWITGSGHGPKNRKYPSHILLFCLSTPAIRHEPSTMNHPSVQEVMFLWPLMLYEEFCLKKDSVRCKRGFVPTVLDLVILPGNVPINGLNVCAWLRWQLVAHGQKTIATRSKG